MSATPRVPVRRHGEPAVAAIVGRSAAGMLLVGTMFVRWVDSGPGSTLSGHRLAAALRTVSSFERWGLPGAIGVYATAIAGLVVLAAAGFPGRLAGLVSSGVGLAPLAALVALVFVGALPVGNWAVAPYMVTSAAACLVTGAALTAVTAPRNRTSPRKAVMR